MRGNCTIRVHHEKHFSTEGGGCRYKHKTGTYVTQDALLNVNAIIAFVAHVYSFRRPTLEGGHQAVQRD